MSSSWTDVPVPAQLHLACGGTVEHAVGTPVFNYYDHKVGVIERVAEYPDAPTMGCHDRDGGAAFWVTVRQQDGSTTLLDQSRMCTVEHAIARGWLNTATACEGITKSAVR